MKFADLSIRVLFLFVSFVIASPSLFATHVFAQASTLEELQQQWSKMETEFAEQQNAIDAEDGDNKKLREEYRDLIDQANALVRKIKSAAIERIKADPQDVVAIRSAMGILLNDAENGRDQEVLEIGDVLIENKIDPRYFEVAAKANRLSIRAREIFEELLIRQRETVSDDLPRVKLETTKGDIVVELYENQAPNTVSNFITLVESGQYSDVLFHRVLEGFMAQAGEKKSDGSSAPELNYTIACECYTPEARPHFSHCISMAHGGKNTGGGQFFLTFVRTSRLDGLHTCFGRVVSGGEVLDRIERTHIAINGEEPPIPNVEKDKIIGAEVIRKRDHDYQVVKFGQKVPDPVVKQEKPPLDPNLSQPTDEAKKESVELETVDEVDKTEAVETDSKETNSKEAEEIQVEDKKPIEKDSSEENPESESEKEVEE